MHRLTLSMILAVTLLLAALWLLLAPTPAAPGGAPLAREDLQALRDLVRKQSRPSGELHFDSSDGDRLLRWLLQQRDLAPGWRSMLRFEGDRAHLILSRGVPFPPRPWLNLKLELSVSADTPRVQRVSAGALPLPRAPFQQRLDQRWQRLRTQGRNSWGEIDQIRISNGQLTLRYRFDGENGQSLQQRSAALWFGPEVESRLRHYRRLLEDPSQWPGRRTSLATVMGRLLREAANTDNEPVSEHTALLLALAHQEHDPAIAALLQLGRRSSDSWLQPTLYRRRDLAQHFVLAGALSLYTGDTEASQLGLLKELEDQGSRTGFGAADLLADWAGIAFAQRLTHPRHAHSLRRRLSSGLQEADLMPSPATLPSDLRAELDRLAAASEDRDIHSRLEALLAPLLDELPARAD